MKFFYSAKCFGNPDREEDNKMNAKSNYLHQWLLPFNGLQDWTPYYRCLVGNIPEFIPLDNSINRDILHSLSLHCIFSCFVLKG